MLDLMRTDVEQRQIPDAPDIPSTVVLAGRVAAIPSGILPFDTEAYALALQPDRAGRLRGWANERRGGRFVVSAGGHFVHADDPELVIAALRQLLRALD